MLAPLRTHVKSVAVVAVAPLALTFASDEYVVEPGDTASGIAAEHGITVADLVAANDLGQGGHMIYAGETLDIPSAHAPDREPQPGPDARRTVWHTVQPGDTVSELASEYHAWTDELVEVNRLGSTGAITVGERLRIPVVLAAVPDDAAPDQPTDTGDHGLPDPSHEQVRSIIENTASRYGVDPNLALAVSWQEAGWQQDHVSSADAIGAMQVLPSTGEWISSVIGESLDLRNVRDNVTAGVVLLDELEDVATPRGTIAGYYQGLQSVQDDGLYDDTKQYVRNVIYLKSQFERGDYPY